MDRDTKRMQSGWTKSSRHAFRTLMGSNTNHGPDFNKSSYDRMRLGNAQFCFYDDSDGPKELSTESTCSSISSSSASPSCRFLHDRSASLTSLCSSAPTHSTSRLHYQLQHIIDPSTMDHPARVSSAPLPSTSARPSSPSSSSTSSWKRFLSFRRNPRPDTERGRALLSSSDRPLTPVSINTMTDDSRSIASECSRARDFSPESLRRFLASDDTVTPAPCCPMTPLATPEDQLIRPALVIPEDIAEENEDDENFAMSAVIADGGSYFPTSLSPPPSRPSHGRSGSASATSASRTMLSRPGTSPSPRPRRVDLRPISPVSSDVSISQCDQKQIGPSVHLTSPLFGQFRLPIVADGRRPLVDEWMAGL